jgi:glutathione synthase/RimK-type ligase-like ATP-grasp enzyme
LLEEEFDTNVGFNIWRREWNSHLNGLYTSIVSVHWLNPLRKAYKGENKYLQMQCASNVGFHLPEYRVSNEKDELLRFVKDHDGSVIKFMNQDIFKNDQGKFCGAYVNPITVGDLDDFGVEENPVFVQQRIDKNFEVRYTVVGNDHFVCKIDSQKSTTARDDWRRYDLPHTPHSITSPPIEIRSKVERFMGMLQIPFGAIDFIVTPDGEWYFLEINCMGQWLWIEELTGLAISDAIVQWLIKNNKEEHQ